MARALFAAALFVPLALSGCGTFANLSLGARQGWKNALIYGGVRRDVQSTGDWIEHSWTWGKNLDLQQDLGTVVGVGLIGIDLPLSAIGDTLTLPITIPAAIWGDNRTPPTVSGKGQTPTVPPANPSPAVVQPVAPPPPPPPNNASRSLSPSGRKAPDGSSPSP